MPNYRRNYVPGGTYFFTAVTHQRRPLFDRDSTRELLRTAIQDIRGKRPFAILAMVLLPDHLHGVWTLPEGDADYSTRWRQIKEGFTRSFLDAGGKEGAPQRPASGTASGRSGNVVSGSTPAEIKML